MHIAAYKMTMEQTVPALKRLQKALDKKSRQWHSIVKIGRTHLEDAIPLTVGQEWSGYTAALGDAITECEHATSGLLRLAMGGTGLNSPEGFGDEVAAVIAKLTGYPFQTAENKFAAQGTLDRMVRAHAGLKAASVTLFKIANDMRWLGSGPRTGLMELIFPSNEPGSSIMPGKVNPTRAEAMMMVTALSPIIGYGNASVIAHYAIDNNLSLKEAASKNGVTEELFDRVVVPINMTHPDRSAPKAAVKRASSTRRPAAKSATSRKRS